MLLKLQNTILKMIAKGESLQATFDRLCREIEALAPGVVCSVLAKDKNGTMHPLAGPSLPAEYNAAIDGIAAGSEVGSCGAAAFLSKPIAVVELDPGRQGQGRLRFVGLGWPTGQEQPKNCVIPSRA